VKTRLFYGAQKLAELLKAAVWTRLSMMRHQKILESRAQGNRSVDMACIAPSMRAMPAVTDALARDPGLRNKRRDSSKSTPKLHLNESLRAPSARAMQKLFAVDDGDLRADLGVFTYPA